ncbi:MAG: PAC2 family protein [Candidatus Thermofonsia bacterium]|nr:MAG: PAC2 family protein [Candidatus Thermofonsia bacterium]
MSNPIELWEKPTAHKMYMIAGWRQWADAGSISSRLPKYLVKQTNARQIGELKADDFYLFQIPGTHDLVRPVVNFQEGFPTSLDTPTNTFHYAGDDENGVVFFLGDEPHLRVEQYVTALLDTAESLNVQRIITFGGVYGELPYDKERMISAIYSLPSLKEELAKVAVNLSDYQGGASIGSYLCRRAAERNMAHVGLYAFVPTYDFSQVAEIGSTIRLENDHMAWLGVMRRINYMLNLDFDLSDLERRSAKLVEVLDDKVAEIDAKAPQLGVRDYMAQLSAQFSEVAFAPLDHVWDEELDRLFNDGDGEEIGD